MARLFARGECCGAGLSHIASDVIWAPTDEDAPGDLVERLRGKQPEMRFPFIQVTPGSGRSWVFAGSIVFATVSGLHPQAAREGAEPIPAAMDFKNSAPPCLACNREITNMTDASVTAFGPRNERK